MKKSFARRGVPRKIGGDEDEEPSTTSNGETSDGKQFPCESIIACSDASISYRPLIDSPEPSVVVKRPSNKVRKSSALRTSFGPSALSGDDDESSSSIVTPKRRDLSRLAIQRNAENRASENVPFRIPGSRDEEDDRPSYSKDYLQELKQSTPSTPKDLLNTPTDLSNGPPNALDLASKFGTDLSHYAPSSIIPSDTEIREKKERRARLAKEAEFISLSDDDASNPSDDENTTRDHTGRLILKPVDKQPESRLVHDDEDIFEDFDTFTSDGKMALGRNAERAAAVARKAEMAAMIAAAEGADLNSNSGGEDDDDDSELERNAAFEKAQTRHGTYASRAEDEGEVARPRTPPRIAPVPTLDGVLEQLKKRLLDMQAARARKLGEMQRLVAEKQEIQSEEVRVQSALKETAEKYKTLRVEMGITNEEKTQVVPVSTNGDAMDESMGFGGERAGLGAGMGLGFDARHGLGHGAGLGSSMAARGLESLGGTPITAGSDSSD